MFSPLYGRHKWLCFPGFILNSTLYTQFKWLYVLNFTYVLNYAHNPDIYSCAHIINYTLYVIRAW